MGDLTLPLTTFDSETGTLSRVGGKGRSLGQLATAGFPVPDGFLLSTQAYQSFIEENGLQSSIQEAVEATSHESAMDSSSGCIRPRFEQAKMSGSVAAAIALAYSALGEPPVAVRSSATAEDLPEQSFAGQQDSFLNVCGITSVLDAIRCCWASLWTARAIRYREQMHIDQRSAAMGVIVQAMVPAEVSGILFTANPTNGDRSELVVNASFGLGEAIVGGLVTPDTYVLDRARLEVKTRITGTKEKMIVPADGDGLTTCLVPDARRREASLSPEELKELATLSLEAEQLFEGVPQDLEWAMADGQCWLLQSRPITNLPPPPLEDVSWKPPGKGTKLIRRQVVEHMPEPLSPLFEALYVQVGLERAIDQFLVEFGMPDIDIDLFLERPMFLTVNGYAYCRASYRWSWRLLLLIPRMLYAYVRILPKLFKNMIPDWQNQHLPSYLDAIEPWKEVDLIHASDERLLAGVRTLTAADARYWFHVSILLGAAKVTDGLLDRFLRSRYVPGALTSGVFLRGFPSPTAEAQAALEQIAQQIRDQESECDLLRTAPTAEMLEILQRRGLYASDQMIHEYLQRYGHQIYNLDFVQPTLVEDPLPVLLSLKSLLKEPGQPTRIRQLEMAETRDVRVKETLAKLGPIRRWLFQKLLGWAQHYGPYREAALFYMGSAWPTLRRLAKELGGRLVEAGTFSASDDVFYLTSEELEEACTAHQENRSRPDLGRTAGDRRQLREARKRLHAPGMIPESSRFKIGPFDMSAFATQKRNADDATTLRGFAVSPGKVTGTASVILTSADFQQMQPHTILVCPITTPAWTPLFAQAAGLVTDIGGILAHGSIVAREYGIPAVMGTGNATRRIVSGQTITVDGDAGTVMVHEEHTGPQG